MTQTEIFSFVVQTLYWFFLYGCIGWGVEVVYAAIKERRLVNRGFLCGPICPIYGCGMVVLNWTVAALAPPAREKASAPWRCSLWAWCSPPPSSW